IELFPDSWDGTEYGGGNLANVFWHRVGVLDEVQTRARVNRSIQPDDSLGHMAQRKKTHALVGFILREGGGLSAYRDEDAPVRMHHAFGFAGCARCVYKDRDMIGGCAVTSAVELIRIGSVVVGAFLLQVDQHEYLIVVEAAETFRVDDDDVS